MGGGSGGGGTTTSQQHAEYPVEFRPLAEAAVKQIIGLQGRLPLAEFGVAQPARVAGLSPFTEAGMSLVPSLMMRSPQEQALQQVPMTLGDILGQFGPVMQPTNPVQQSLGFLGGQMGGRNAQLFPQAFTPPRTPQIAQFAQPSPTGQSIQPSPTAFPGFQAPVVPQAQSGGAGAGGVLEAAPLMSMVPPLPMQTQFDQFVAEQQAQLAALQAQQQQQSGPRLPPGAFHSGFHHSTGEPIYTDPTTGATYTQAGVPVSPAPAAYPSF